MNITKYFFYTILLCVNALLGYSGPASVPTAGADAANVSLSGSEFTIHAGLRHAIQTGISCAEHRNYRDCWECCQKLGVEDHYMETCAGVCEELKLKKSGRY